MGYKASHSATNSRQTFVSATYEVPPIAGKEGVPSSEWYIQIDITIAGSRVGLSTIPGLVTKDIGSLGAGGDNSSAVVAKDILAADITIDNTA